MDEKQQRRIALEESAFRDLNERQVTAAERFHGDGEAHVLDVLCECALANCDQMIALEAEQYRRLRSNASWFVVLPDHAIEAAETVVERSDGFWIIEKHPGRGADVAEGRA